MADENSACRALRVHYSLLAEGIQDPERLACELYSSSVVSQEVLAAVSMMPQTPLQQKMKLLDGVRCAVAVDEATFSVFVAALKDRPELDHLAEMMEALYSQLVQSAQQSSTESQAHLPAVERGVAAAPVRLECECARKARKMLVSGFTQIVLKVKQQVKEKKVGASEFRDEFLLGLCISNRCDHEKYFEKYLQMFIDQKTIDGIFCCLHIYWDYLNSDLLQSIVIKYGNKSIETNMEQFLKAVDKFRRSTTLRVFWIIEGTKYRREIPPGLERVKTRLKQNITPESTLEVVDQIRIEVADEFQLQKFSLYIEAIVDGSVVITWFVPPSVIDVLKFGLTAKLLDELNIETITLCPQEPEEKCIGDISEGLEILPGRLPETPQLLDTETRTSLPTASKFPEFDERHTRTAETTESIEVEPTPLSGRPEPTAAQQKYGKQLLAASKYVLSGGHSRVKALLELGADPNTRDVEYGRTPLMWASFRNYHKTVEALLHHPSSAPHIAINTQDKKGWSALMLACEKGSLSIAALLVKDGANIDLQNSGGWSALMRAAYTGRQKVAQFLLENGAKTDLKDAEGWTALLAASQKGNKKIAQMLLDYKADPNAVNEIGMSALMSASQGDHLDIVRLLKERGATVNLQRQDGVTALHIACDRNNVKVVDELYQTEGIELNVEDEDHFTPLMIASNSGHGKVVKILFGAEKKADTGKKTGLGWTALFLAVKEGKTDVAETLLQNGADPTLKDADDNTVLDIAKEYRRDKKLYKLLVNALEQIGHQQTTFQDPKRSVVSMEELLVRLQRRLLPGREEKRRALRSPSDDTAPELTTAL